MYVGLHVQYRYSCQILMKLEFSRQRFEQYSNIKFHENPSSGSWNLPCGRTQTQANNRFSRRRLNRLVSFSALFNCQCQHHVHTKCMFHATKALLVPSCPETSYQSTLPGSLHWNIWHPTTHCIQHITIPPLLFPTKRFLQPHPHIHRGWMTEGVIEFW
jgi:hypothetical protein